MKAMETIDDLLEEAKLRFVWWGLCIFSLAYFLSHTSTSMWLNLPISVFLISASRLVLCEIEFRWRVRSPNQPLSYLSYLEKKQLSVSDSRLAPPLPAKWKRKIGSLVVEAAVGELVDKILKDFVLELWYQEITPDTDAVELMRAVIMDALGEVSGRLKEINLVDLVTRDAVDLVGDHLDLFRRNQAAIGTDVMATLSTEERDERLKHHLINSKELHPALLSPENEFKVLKRLVSGILANVLRPREVQCPLVRTIARDILTSLVLQPVMELASPGYINEVLEAILVLVMEYGSKELPKTGSQNVTTTISKKVGNESNGDNDGARSVHSIGKVNYERSDSLEGIHNQDHVAEWARMLEAATQKRTETLAPENLENMWAKGRNYKRKDTKYNNEYNLSSHINDLSVKNEKNMKDNIEDEKEHEKEQVKDRNNKIKRSISASLFKTQVEDDYSSKENFGRHIISEFYIPEYERNTKGDVDKQPSEIIVRNENSHAKKLRCRVVGAYFEKLGSKSFAVYSIAVTDVGRTWFVKRRYRNFERLHRFLKDIPNYSLHLPPKRIFSSSTEDAFVHQRCIHLDKYLHDLLSIANIAEQHEVWDFLSDSSKNYSFGKSSSVMKTLAVNVDDAVDDIVRQFKGVSGGLMRTIVGPSSLDETNNPLGAKNLSWHGDDLNKFTLNQEALETGSTSENEHGIDKDENDMKQRDNGWHSDSELNSLPPRVINIRKNLKRSFDFDVKTEMHTSHPLVTNLHNDHMDIPPEWTPPNVSVPLLNLVDKVFLLNRRGWLRRQVFWISKQILQLMMEDAIDDWLLRQICWLRKEETVAESIRWVQNILWPGGTFFTRLRDQNESKPNTHFSPFQMTVPKEPSFEEQLEAARRVSNIKKILFEGAPAALVSLIGQKQYRRCARDIFYFTQSTVCGKQLAYAILELLVVSIFPELRDLILELHKSQ